MRVVLDSNVLVSALATRGLCEDVLRLVLAEHELVTTGPIIQEVTRVLARKFRVPRTTVEEIGAFLGQYAATAGGEAASRVAVRDPDDEIVLGAAIAAEADVLVTGDRDLLEVRQRVIEIRILDPRAFQGLVVRPG